MQGRQVSDVCEVVITAPDHDWLVEFARRLVTGRLCASAHNFTPVDLPVAGSGPRPGGGPRVTAHAQGWPRGDRAARGSRPAIRLRMSLDPSPRSVRPCTDELAAELTGLFQNSKAVVFELEA